MNAPEFPCDKDLEPYVKAGQLTAWQAMEITTCRAASNAHERLVALEKKMADLTTRPPEKPIDSVLTIVPKYR